MDADRERTTATLAGARVHARAQATRVDASFEFPDGVRADDVFWSDTVEFGNYASSRVPRGAIVRFADPVGDASVQLFVLNAVTPTERLNVADTVKVQWQAYLGAGALLLSDMGRVLMTVVGDTSERHDCLCGATTRATSDAKFGDGRASGPTPNARDLLCVAAAKYGLGRRDVGPNANLFKGVRVAADGSLAFDGESAPGTYVELRAELDVLVLVANTPHPLDPRRDYAGSAVQITGRTTPAVDDPLWAATPERERAFENTNRLLRSADA